MENHKLPMVIYDELQIPATFEAPNLCMSNHTSNGTTATLPSKTKDAVNDHKDLPSKTMDKTSTNRNKDQKKKGGEGKLPPLSISLVLSD